MSSFGNSLIASKVTADDFAGKGMTIGRDGRQGNVPEARSQINLLGTEAIFNFDASQSGNPGIADFNMAGLLSKFRIQNLPIVTGPTNTPPDDDQVPVNGLYVYTSNPISNSGQIFMKLISIPPP